MTDNYKIYKHTSPSNKSYIGLTKNLKKRKNQHTAKSSGCPAFYRAIQKYGWDNFTHEILMDNLSLEKANEYEQLHIKEHNTLSPNGYNLKSGGNCGVLCKEIVEQIANKTRGQKRPRTEEHQRNLTAALKGRISPTKGKKMPPQSEETKRKRADAIRGTKHSKESVERRAAKRTGQKLSKETRQKMSIAQKGRTRTPESNIKRSQTLKGRKLLGLDPITGKRVYYFPN